MALLLECKHTPVDDIDAGEQVCSSCGIVLMEKVAAEDEYSTYDHDIPGGYMDSVQRMTHVGETTIIPHVKNIPIAPVMKETMYRLRMWDNRIQSRTKDHTPKLLSAINTPCDRLALPQYVKQEIMNLFKKIRESGRSRGHRYNEVVATCILAICKRDHIPKKLVDIAKVTNVAKKRIFRSYQKYIDIFDEECAKSFAEPSDYVAQISSKLDIDQNTVTKARNLLVAIKDSNSFIGRSPVSVSAAALYITCIYNGMPISQKRIAEAADITDVTIRNTATAIKKTIDIESALEG